MKKCLAILCLLLTVTTSAFAGASFTSGLKTGTYELRGSNDPSGNLHYRGEVTIKPQGTNYFLTWKVGNHQAQYGIGILDGNVLSVSFLDTSNGAFGVVSFVVISENELDGKWAAIRSTSHGREYLVWKSY